MKIILNNREEVFSAARLTIAEMIELKKFSFKMKIIKLNGKLISKDAYQTTFIEEGDQVQMIYLMSGG
jgi:thiamine biosynthesis protein ThiS